MNLNFISKDVMEQYKEQADKAYEKLKFDSKEMKDNVISLAELGKKLGGLIADYANHSAKIEGSDLARYVGNHLMMGMHEKLDHDLDYEKFMKNLEEDGDDDGIEELIANVLKELRNL